MPDFRTSRLKLSDSQNLTFRRGTQDDLRPAYDIFTQAADDLNRRTGMPAGENEWADPAFIAEYWDHAQPLFEHLMRTADQYWVAERDGQIIGVARSSLRDGVRELLEFSVLPAHQVQGVGRELLARAFSADSARHRVVTGTTDVRSLARYLKSGLYPRFPEYYFHNKPHAVTIETDLKVEPVTAAPETLAALRSIDKAILDFERDPEHEFLLSDRECCLYYRGAQLVGYGYFGNGTGPIALLNESDFPAVLARGETEAAAREEDNFGVQVPLINRAAVDYLLGRGFRLEPFTALFFCDETFGKFENYIFTSPPFFM